MAAFNINALGQPPQLQPPQPQGIPGFNVGGLSGQPLPQMPQLNMNPAPAPKAQGGMFAHGAGKFLTDFILNYAAGMGNPIGTEHLDAMRQKQAQAMQEAQYQQHRDDDFNGKVKWAQWQQQNAPEEAPIVRDTHAYMNMSDPEKAAYREVHPGQIVNMTLPNGMFYSGPAEGVAEALRGAQPQMPKPVGRLTPIGGGPTPQASGTFPR